MQELRGTRKEEYESVIGLINQIFRTSKDFAPTMHLEYPLLLGNGNLDSMRIILEDGQPVSTVSYYTSHIKIEGASLKAASVGSVCTHPDYRGRNYASLLMDDAEARMMRDGVDVMLVSGDLNLYRRRGCTAVGGFRRAMLEPAGTKDDISLTELNRANMEEAARLYHKEPVRFLRSYDQFVRLQESVKAHRSIVDYRSCLVLRKGKAAAYFVARITLGTNTAAIREFAGDRRAVLDGVQKFMEMQGVGQCTLVIPRQDPLNLLLEEDGLVLEPQGQQGTIKILNYVSLMNSLKPYMRQYLTDETMDRLSFAEQEGKYMISFEGESLTIENRDLLGQLIFGQTGCDGLADCFNKNELDDKPKLLLALKTVFPVPFPWTANMNFV
jgi:predicted acetyltransferase